MDINLFAVYFILYTFMLPKFVYENERRKNSTIVLLILVSSSYKLLFEKLQKVFHFFVYIDGILFLNFLIYFQNILFTNKLRLKKRKNLQPNMKRINLINFKVSNF